MLLGKGFAAAQKSGTDSWVIKGLHVAQRKEVDVTFDLTYNRFKYLISNGYGSMSNCVMRGTSYIVSGGNQC